MLTESNLKINKLVRIKVDKGFQGIQKLYQNAEIPNKSDQAETADAQSKNDTTGNWRKNES
jgi:hypothetical protein